MDIPALSDEHRQVRPAEPATAFDREAAHRALARLAQAGVYVGTSSWKYPGWRGMLYDETRYVYRGKFALKRFEQQCLAEYAEVFSTVCVDGAYYKFPDQRYLESLMSQVPASFRFGFKVTDAITIKRFYNLPRFGERAGKVNEHFLDADLFAKAFLAPCQPFQPRIGLLIFEFSHFYPTDYARGRDFMADLDVFLGKLPPGWPYGVEIRNPHFLHPAYFATLSRHNVAHVFNNWSGMPSVSEQLALPGSRTSPILCGARFLLTPGRKYAEAVDTFKPYDQVRQPDSAARTAGASLIQEGMTQAGQRKTYIFVNNRLEGNALSTIRAMLEQAAQVG